MTGFDSEIVAWLPLVVWIYLLVGRGWFWLAGERDDSPVGQAPSRAKVVAVIPARNEADSIADTVQALLVQDYPCPFEVIVVDDQSDDGTADLVRQAAVGQSRPLTVVEGQAPPPGWTGKLWALRQGIDRATQAQPDFLLFIDADIHVAPDTVSSLVARAEAGHYVLVSLMAKLHCASLAERWLIPAFIFFYRMLYPFRWVNQASNRTATAAGGCMLVRPNALAAAGGIGAIRGELIDDRALGAALKAQGPIWFGLTNRVRSMRPYDGIGGVRRMVARYAYAQLRYSPAALAGCIAGMVLTYLAPPLFALFGQGIAQGLGVLGWAAMAIAYQPVLRFYRVSPLYGLVLPLIAAIFLGFTLDSAYQHMRGGGGNWKGRVNVRETDCKVRSTPIADKRR